MNCTKRMDGKLLYQLLICGFQKLNDNTHYLNDINVFPVSDADTGTNMKRTFETGINELVVSSSFTDVFSSFMQGMLLGSRGNSGSILSQYFLGIYEYTKGNNEVSVVKFCRALKSAYKTAYRAVLQPVEGTILTVMRESIENTIAQVNKDTSLEQFLDIFTVELFLCVQNTKNKLDILRLNDVVDSGAVGFYLIFDGMKSGLFSAEQASDNEMLLFEKSEKSVQNPLIYRYCTEFLLITRADYTKEFFIGKLDTKGDSLIVTFTDRLLKVHIHTNEPQDILDEFSAFGDLAETKVDDMLLQQ